GFPFKSKEYTDPKSVDYAHVEVPNAKWHETHTFTCFAFPTFTEEDMHQIAAGLTKVIRHFAND
ncbi:MAG: DegT/DnrJ/EryC1/StrS family aminotransferase, partial [Spirochaetia bacterium]|nr:DegT/DnrJ/EryC1/StrS family aminotransferase [Spirochaetia bacterium]